MDAENAIFTCWFRGGDLEAEIVRQGIDDIYAPISWYCLLSSYGNYPPLKDRATAPGAVDMADVEHFVAGCAANFPSHRDALAALASPVRS